MTLWTQNTWIPFHISVLQFAVWRYEEDANLHSIPLIWPWRVQIKKSDMPPTPDALREGDAPLTYRKFIKLKTVGSVMSTKGIVNLSWGRFGWHEVDWNSYQFEWWWWWWLLLFPLLSGINKDPTEIAKTLFSWSVVIWIRFGTIAEIHGKSFGSRFRSLAMHSNM